ALSPRPPSGATRHQIATCRNSLRYAENSADCQAPILPGIRGTSDDVRHVVTSAFANRASTFPVHPHAGGATARVTSSQCSGASRTAPAPPAPWGGTPRPAPSRRSDTPAPATRRPPAASGTAAAPAPVPLTPAHTPSLPPRGAPRPLPSPPSC